MAPVMSRIAIRNGTGFVPPATFIQPDKGEVLWWKYFVGVWTIIGGLLTLCLVYFEVKRRAANAGARENEPPVNATQHANAAPAQNGAGFELPTLNPAGQAYNVDDGQGLDHNRMRAEAAAVEGPSTSNGGVGDGDEADAEPGHN